MSRKQKKYHYIYKTTNLLSGKYYIGMHSTSNLEDGYMGSGKRLRYSLNKYGKENHAIEILEFVNSREELKKREEEIVNLNEIAKVDCMNLIVGGGINGFMNKNHQLKCQQAGGRKTFQLLGMKHVARLKIDNEYREKWIISLKNADNKGFLDKMHSQETKLKMSNSHKGKHDESKNSQYGTCWITNEKESKKIMKGDLISKGWRLGRKIK